MRTIRQFQSYVYRLLRFWLIFLGTCLPFKRRFYKYPLIISLLLKP